MQRRGRLICGIAAILSMALGGCGESPAPSTSHAAGPVRHETRRVTVPAEKVITENDSSSSAPLGPSSSVQEPATSVATEPTLVPQVAHLSVTPARKPKARSPLEPPTDEMPKVLLSAEHEATCLVKVGDSLPATMLTNLAGEQKALTEFYGPRLTVVLFWSSGDTHALAELADLGPDVADPLASRGVRVVAINVQEPAQRVREVAEPGAVNVPILLDPNGAYFARVAEGGLPRTYLVNATGKILWFDLDYTYTTRRDLQRALRAILGKE